ncbi:uncharacterized protein PADG_05091 [Paracoccidioides brasiliensis Pb18]|uniref:Uncharacterized protein n=2 Tax=Paracoccidioides brasiliensis TaxID=121759 RepID=C1GCV5_PARBD|nr:uncharacterized protein PADG_05091 [Paracoccidioides brasiliensis Pb18]EEH49012.2 hypothetical protein PADG_05091 [Paracoccidioides brasiliensis Pb18]
MIPLCCRQPPDMVIGAGPIYRFVEFRGCCSGRVPCSVRIILIMFSCTVMKLWTSGPFPKVTSAKGAKPSKGRGQILKLKIDRFLLDRYPLGHRSYPVSEYQWGKLRRGEYQRNPKLRVSGRIGCFKSRGDIINRFFGGSN